MFLIFFFNDTATTEIYTLSLHDALPISTIGRRNRIREFVTIHRGTEGGGMLTRTGDDCLIMAQAHIAHDCLLGDGVIDRKSTRLNSSHANISYAVFCLKKKNNIHSLKSA